MIVDVIGGSKQAKSHDHVMHVCDMFEPFKRFALHSRIDVTTDDPHTAIEAVKHAYLHEGGYFVFVGVLNGGDPVYILEPGISVISTISGGNSGWLMFGNMLKSLGYTPVTDSTMKVTSLVKKIQEVSDAKDTM